MHFQGECGNWLTVFVRACWCRCSRRLPRYSVRAGRGACPLARSRNLRNPHVIFGRYSATRAQRTALTHTHTCLHGLHPVMVSGLNRREWALREACTSRTLSGPWFPYAHAKKGAAPCWARQSLLRDGGDDKAGRMTAAIQQSKLWLRTRTIIRIPWR